MSPSRINLQKLLDLAYEAQVFLENNKDLITNKYIPYASNTKSLEETKVEKRQ